MRIHFFTILICTILSLSCKGQEGRITWSNPISEGLNVYGMKDFFAYAENDRFYLVGTEYKDAFQGYLGPNLYVSNTGAEWKKISTLINTKQIPETAWYKDVWAAPELFQHKGMYYFTFNNRNNSENAYQKLGFGIAKSKSLEGPYEVINTHKPTVLGNHGSITFSPEGVPFLTYDMDGRMYIAELDLETAMLKTEPIELLGPKTLKENYKYMDAPNITKINDTYHLLFSQFYGGYVVKIFHMTADHPKGPWHWSDNNPLYTFLEAEADLEVKMTYPEKHGFAPPTQVIFSHDLVKGSQGAYLMLYHSSEKYSEPYLNLEPVSISENGVLTVHQPKAKSQTLVLDEK